MSALVKKCSLNGMRQDVDWIMCRHYDKTLALKFTHNMLDFNIVLTILKMKKPLDEHEIIFCRRSAALKGNYP